MAGLKNQRLIALTTVSPELYSHPAGAFPLTRSKVFPPKGLNKCFTAEKPLRSLFSLRLNVTI